MVMFCKVTVITEAANTLVTLFLAANQYITLLMCFCLKTPYWIHTVDPFPLNSQSTAPYLMPEQILSHTRVFTGRHMTASWHVGTVALAPLNSEINTRHKNVKSMAFSSVRKGRSFTVWELKQEGGALPWLTLAGNIVTQFFLPLCTCLQTTMKALHILILELEINGANLQMIICE